MTQSQKEAIERGVALLPELKNATFEGDPWITLRSGHVETIIAALEAAKVLAEEAVSSKLAHDCGFNAGLIMGRAAAPGAGGEMVEQLRTAIAHIEHMGAFIAANTTGYSFESIGEDMPAMKNLVK